MIFDSHAHYDDTQFDEDREEVLASLLTQGIGTVVNVSATLDSCAKVVELAQSHKEIYAAVGVHPDEVGSLDERSYEGLKRLCVQNKVVAIGEIGLDYYWEHEPHEIQKTWFIRQLQLAQEMKLPVLIHSREASEETFEIIREYGEGLTGVIHCFSSSAEMAKEYIKLGYYIGVGGVVTYSNGKKLKKVVEEIGLESILLETDCPYLAPVPNRGTRNTSLNLKYVVDEIARLKEVTCEEVIEQTEINAKKMFGL
ncbi:MAG: TatD family hydrolase [Lachnospiraceae bacterium]